MVKSFIIIVTLFVIIAPLFPSHCTEEDETRNEGDTVVLEHCPFTSPVQLSELHFQWSVKNGNGEWTRITPGGRFSVNHDGFLTISNVQLSDSGLYRINISNNQGNALHTVRLQVTRAKLTLTLT
jgi:flagellar basal body rod protein FlgG